MIKYLMLLFLSTNLLAFGQVDRDSIVGGTGAYSQNFERNGPSIEYHKEDNLFWRAYYENGKILSEGKFKKKLKIIKFHLYYYHVKHGIFKYYSEKGELEKIEYYKNNKLLKAVVLDTVIGNAPNELVE